MNIELVIIVNDDSCNSCTGGRKQANVKPFVMQRKRKMILVKKFLLCYC
jgi:hypothetical protein